MLKALVKLFIPSAEKLSKLAAAKAADAVNDCGRAEAIGKYATISADLTLHAQRVAEILKDGKVDATEEDEIARTLEPLFATILKLI